MVASYPEKMNAHSGKLLYDLQKDQFEQLEGPKPAAKRAPALSQKGQSSQISKLQIIFSIKRNHIQVPRN